MRLLNLYIVLDTRAKALVGNVIAANSHIPLVREIQAQLEDPKSLIGRNPEDFCVLCVGRIDDTTGQLYDLEDDANIFCAPELLAQARALARAPQSP